MYDVWKLASIYLTASVATVDMASLAVKKANRQRRQIHGWTLI